MIAGHEVRVSTNGRARIVELAGALNEQNRNEILRSILDSKYIILDLSRLEFIQSDDIGFLLSTKKVHRERWGTHMHIFKVVAGAGKVRHAIEEMRMEHIIPTYRTLQEAVAIIPRKRILHIEEDDEFAQAIEILLETNGFEVVRSASIGAVEAMNERDFDLCVTEIEFGGKNDPDLVRRLRLQFGCPIIVVTAGSAPQPQGSAMLIRKPIVIAQFMKTVSEMLEQPVHEYYETIIDALPLPIAVYSGSDTLRVNRAWRQYFHIMRNDSLLALSSAFSDDAEKEFVLGHLMAATKNAETRTVNLSATAAVRISPIGGRSQPFHLLVTILDRLRDDLSSAMAEDRMREVMLSLLEDLDQARVRLSAANDQLQEVDRLKSEFISAVSHELRTPMTAIKGAAENILDGFHGQIPADQQKTVEIILRNSKRLARLIENLLDSSKIESGSFELRKRRSDLREPIRIAIEDLKIIFEKSGIGKTVTMPDVPVLAEFDPERMIQVVINLVDNGIRFAASEVAVTLRHDGEWATLTVEDDGPGVPESERERIFERFACVAAHHNRSRTGLGLSIVRNIVEGQGGRIRSESRPGLQGARFVVTVPLAGPAGERISIRNEEQPVACA